jgi:hypothetical protein
MVGTPVSSQLARWGLGGLQSGWKPKTEWILLIGAVVMYCLGPTKLWFALRHQYLADGEGLMHMTESRSWVCFQGTSFGHPERKDRP